MSTNLQPYDEKLIPEPDTRSDMHMDGRGRPAYTAHCVRRILADSHAHYEKLFSAASANGPSIAQVEAGAQALHECGFGGEEGKAARAATADSVWRAMQEVPGAPVRVAQPAASLAAWLANNVPELQQRMYRVSDVEAMRDALLPECWAAAIASVHPAGDAAMPVVAHMVTSEKANHKGLFLFDSHAEDMRRSSAAPTDARHDALVRQSDAQAALAAKDGLIAGLEADLVEERNRIASMRTEWGAEVAALTQTIADSDAVVRAMEKQRTISTTFRLAERERADAHKAELTAQAKHAEDVADAAKARIAELEDRLSVCDHHLSAYPESAPSMILSGDIRATLDNPTINTRGALSDAPAVSMGGAGVTVTLAQPDSLDWDAPDRRPQPCCGDPTNCDAAAMGVCSPVAAAEAAGVAACVTCGAPSGVPAAPWRDHAEQRIRTWRQRTMNWSGDRLGIDDFMGAESIDDLVDWVCDEYAGPANRSTSAQRDTAAMLEEHMRLVDEAVSAASGDGSFRLGIRDLIEASAKCMLGIA